MRGIKDVHSIGPIILKFVNHCGIIAWMGETLIYLTATYKILISSMHTVRTSSLGKRVMASHLCYSRRVGCKILLHRCVNLPWTSWLQSSSQKLSRLKSLQACSTGIAQWQRKRRVQLRSFHETRYRTLWNRNEIPDASSWRVQGNWMVIGLEPISWTGTKLSQPRACQMESNSKSIPVLSRRVGSNSLVLEKTRSLRMAYVSLVRPSSQ
jgi:hypothetical protein